MARNQFCACGHNRSFIYEQPNVCGAATCECVKHDTAVAPKKSRTSLKVVEPGPNADKVDVAIVILRSALGCQGDSSRYDSYIRSALSCLEAIS